MSDEKREITPGSSEQGSAGPPTNEVVVSVTSVAEFFADPKLNATRWLRATRSGPFRVLPEDEASALASRIANDKKQLERLLGLLRRLSPAQSLDSAASAALELASRVLRNRVPETFDQAAEFRSDIVLESIARLRRELKPGRERQLWLEAVLRTALLNRTVDPADLPRLVRAAFAPSPRLTKSSSRKGKGAPAGKVLLDEETSFFLSCLGKSPVLSGALTLEGIYRQRMSGLEDSLARLQAQLSERLQECERLKSALLVESDLVKERDSEITKLRVGRQELQAAWDAQRTQALHRIETLRGRMQGLLKGDLALWLETARDAATASPPRIAVVTERLERAIERAAKEAQWLASSDST